MLKDIYYRKRLGIPWIAFLLIATCSIVSIPTYLNNELYQVFSASTRPIYFWQYFSGNFEHCITPKWFFWAHYLGNMSVIIIFGILIERLIGSKKMLILSIAAGVIQSVTFQLFSQGYCTGAGVSGIVWSYAPVALYIIVQIYSYEKKQIFKDKFLLVLIIEFVFIWIFITAVSEWDGTNRSHLISTIVGIVFLMFCRKSIKESVEEIHMNNAITRTQKSCADRLAIILFSIFPLFMLIILGLYQGNKLDKLYVNVISISPYTTLEDMKANDNKIEITFEEPVIQVSSTSTDTPGEAIIHLDISYSEDRRTIILTFDQTLLEEPKLKIVLREIEFADGRRAKPIELNIE